MVNNLQYYISQKLKRGMSLRDIERESKVDHSNLSRYMAGKDPDHKNLAKLSDYFGCEFHELLLPYKPSGSQLGAESTLEDQLAQQVWDTLTPDEKLQVVQYCRRLKEGRGTQDQG